MHIHTYPRYCYAFLRRIYWWSRSSENIPVNACKQKLYFLCCQLIVQRVTCSCRDGSTVRGYTYLIRWLCILMFDVTVMAGLWLIVWVNSTQTHTTAHIRIHLLQTYDADDLIHILICGRWQIGHDTCIVLHVLLGHVETYFH